METAGFASLTLAIRKILIEKENILKAVNYKRALATHIETKLLKKLRAVEVFSLWTLKILLETGVMTT